MAEPANVFPKKLFWVDLEMTGLDPAEDFILEVAAIITDFNFKELVRYEARISYAPEAVSERMGRNPWWETVPENKEEFLRNLDTGKGLEKVEQELSALLTEQFADEPVILAGNSIHQDRKFIARWWPILNKQLHYRMLDVSSLKIYMQGKYGMEFQKKKVHRALDDIEESMAEWEYYLKQLRTLQD